MSTAVTTRPRTTNYDREAVERLLDKGYSTRTIGRITGVSHATVARIGRSSVRSRPTGATSDAVQFAKQVLDARFADFERQPGPRTYGAWQLALREYEEAREK